MKIRANSKKSVIPGFGLSFGIVTAILGLIVVLPLCSLVVYSAQLSFGDFIETVTRPRVLASYGVSISTALIASIINAIVGLALAWVLVRYEFPGKRFMDGIIELPFALPTAVAGNISDTFDCFRWLDWKLFFKMGNIHRVYKNRNYSCISFYRDSFCSKKCAASIGKSRRTV